MKPEFLIDAQLPPALSEYLRSEGYDAKHVADLGMLAASDDLIWRFAVDHKLVILTKDEDFPERQMRKDEGAAVVWLRIGNCSNHALLAWFNRLLPEVVNRLTNGEKFVEII